MGATDAKGSPKGTRFIDLTGKKFNRITVMKDLPGQGGNPRITARCDCGEMFTVFKASVKHGYRKSCGKCGLVKRGRRRAHRLSGTRLYSWWMRHRKAGTLVPEWHDNLQHVVCHLLPLRTSRECPQISSYAFVARDDGELIGPDNCVAVRGGSGRSAGVLVEVDGVVRNVADWGGFLSITRQRAHQLHVEGRLVERIQNQNRLERGRSNGRDS